MAGGRLFEILVLAGCYALCRIVRQRALSRKRGNRGKAVESVTLRGCAFSCVVSQEVQNALKGRCSTTELRP
jgi:hypothetical protein